MSALVGVAEIDSCGPMDLMKIEQAAEAAITFKITNILSFILNRLESEMAIINNKK